MNQAFVVSTEDCEVIGIAHTEKGIAKAIADWYAKQNRCSLNIGEYAGRWGTNEIEACGIKTSSNWNAVEADGTIEYFWVEATTHYFEA